MLSSATTIQSITKEPIKNYTELSGELWLPIKGTDCNYYVSNMGRVLSNRYFAHPGNWGILNPYATGKSRNYLQVKLYVDGRKQAPKVHRLVAEHFIPNPGNLPQVNHKDMNPANNRAENLEWCTNTENQQHYRANTGKLDRAKVEVIRSGWVEWQDTKGSYCRLMAETYGVTPNCIRFVLDGKTWK